MMIRRKMNYIFDFGRVLVGYEPHLVYDKYFGSKEKAEWFIKNVVTEGWMRRLDIGEPFNACIKELQAEFPDYADPIGMYDTHYQEMIHGEIEGMYDLLNELKDKGHSLFGLTNWSYKVYDVIKKYPIFSLLDGMVISSEVHLLKPDVRIYQCLMGKYGLKAEECVFIDDRKENVEAARSIKMQGIVFVDALQLRCNLTTACISAYASRG
jgi:HAD superfamily hydrolase (TIGR01509 family)